MKPKDEAAEWERCEREAKKIVRFLDDDPDVEYTWASKLFEQRSAARAEGYHECRRESAGDKLRIEQLERELRRKS